MKQNKDNLAYIRHIKDAVEKILEYTSEHTLNDFKENEWDQDAVMRNLEIIGEVAARIDNDFKLANPDIAWKEMKDMRNVLIHDYTEVDVQLVWRTITEDIPTLHKKILKLLNSDNTSK